MKPGLIGSVVVVLCGGAVVGAVVLRDGSQLARAQTLRGSAEQALGAGELEAARRDYLLANTAALQVGGLAGLRPQAQTEASAARRGLHLIDALEAAEQDPGQALRLLQGPFLEGFESPPAATQGLVARIRAEALLDAAVELEGRELIDLAAKVFPPAVDALAAVESPRAAEAELGKRRLTTIRNLREAEEAVRNRRAGRSLQLVRQALGALEGAGSPFQDAERLAKLRERLERVQREAESGLRLEELQAKVEALAARVKGPDLGRLLPEVQGLELPELAGDHPLAAEHATRLRGLAARRERILKAATDFSGLVWVKALPRGGLYMDATEVTNGQYAAFMAATKAYETPSLDVWSTEGLARAKDRRFRDAGGGQGPLSWSKGAPPADELSHPVTGVGYLEAEAYARWAGRRLPTLAEFKEAAGGRAFPWGDAYQAGRANVNQSGDARHTQPVGSYPSGRAPSGALDLVGNAREIVREGEEYLLVGGSFDRRPEQSSLDARPAKCTNRLRAGDVGFRCVKELAWDD